MSKKLKNNAFTAERRLSLSGDYCPSLIFVLRKPNTFEHGVIFPKAFISKSFVLTKAKKKEIPYIRYNSFIHQFNFSSDLFRVEGLLCLLTAAVVPIEHVCFLYLIFSVSDEMKQSPLKKEIPNVKREW